MLRIITIAIFTIVVFAPAKAIDFPTEVRDTILPRVFQIGDYEAVYDILLKESEVVLLSACDDNMTAAFDKWKQMLEAIEDYSDEVDYNLYGVKLWVNVFFNKDGSVQHFAYYFKPVSKFIDTKEFNRFMESFLKNYRIPFQYHEQFSHYGTAAFPVVPRVLPRKKKKKKP